MPGGPTTFMQRVGGPLGLFQLISQINTSGVGSSAIALQAIGAAQRGEIALNPTQQQYGEMLRRAGVQTPGGGGASSAGQTSEGGAASTGGGAAVCPESDPNTTPVSEEVLARIKTFESRVRLATAPLGTAIPQQTWLELQSLSFKTPQGIRLARQLLWYVKAMRVGSVGKSTTKFRYNNRIVDLLDPTVEPSSFGEINAETPLFGEHIASRVSNSPETVVGSPFSSAETWDAIRTIRKAVRGAGLRCQKAKGIPGDEWKIFEYFVKGVRGFTRLEIDGQLFEFRMAYHAARGAGAAGYRYIPGSGVAMTRHSFWTIEDRRITVEDRKMPRVVSPGTIGAAVAARDAAEVAAIESRAQPMPIESTLRVGGAAMRGSASGDSASGGEQMRVTPGEIMHVSAELEALFEKFFDLPPFRFDMPLRTDDDYSGLVRSYAERYLHLNRGPTQRSFARGSRTGFATGHVAEDALLTVSIPSIVPPSADAPPVFVAVGLSNATDETLDFEARLQALLEELDES